MNRLLSQKMLLIVFVFGFSYYILTYLKQQKGKEPIQEYGTTSSGKSSVGIGHSSTVLSTPIYGTDDYEFSPQLLFLYK